MATCGKCKQRDMPVEHIRSCHKTREALLPGVYRREKYLFLVYPSHKDSSVLRVKQIIPVCASCGLAAIDHKSQTQCGKFKVTSRKSPGMLSRLRLAQRMSREQVAELGRLWGFCVHCGSALTLPESIERGAGRICDGKYGGGA